MFGVLSSLLREGEKFWVHAAPYLSAAAPLFAFAAGYWLISRTDKIVHDIFPYLEWEHTLGTFNIKAQRRADAGLRLVRLCLYFALASALFGILWAAKALPLWANWDDPWAMGDLALRMPLLAFCLGLWLIYIGGSFVPKMQAERERKLWKKLQLEMAKQDALRPNCPTASESSRYHSPLSKPRPKAQRLYPLKPLTKWPAAPVNKERWRGPGG